MLAQFALIVFAMFAVMGLVVDLGMVTLSRVQMQNAADTAALESLRARDASIDPDPDPNTHVASDDGLKADCLRRSAARNVVSWTFDDDFDLGADALQLGAGPNIQFTDEGVTDLNALQTIDLDAPRVYKPLLQRNQSDNAQHGDMVSGRFTYTSSPEAEEDDAYARADFQKGDPVPRGLSGLPGCPADDNFTAASSSGSSIPTDNGDNDSFLVRLRRTSDRDALANQLGVSSGGPPLPLLFARGTTIGGPDPDTGYSPRRDGISVRATAIAQLRPAMRVGVIPDNPSDSQKLSERGVVAYAVSRDCWNAGWNDVMTVVTLDVDHKTIDLGPSCLPGAVRFIPVAGGWGVGDLVPAVAPPPPPIASCAFPSAWAPVGWCLKGFVAIFEHIGSDDRVIGFGRSAMVDPNDPELETPVMISPSGTTQAKLIRRKARSLVTDQNASAHSPDGLPTLPPAEIDQILAANRSLAAPGDGGLLVPVLVR